MRKIKKDGLIENDFIREVVLTINGQCWLLKGSGFYYNRFVF